MHILLVEDHDESRNVIARLLGHYGYTVEVAGSRAEARALLAQENFNALITDIGLGDGDAYDLIHDARRLPHVKTIVALTGRNGDHDRAQGERAGIDHYLTKPVDFHVLRSLLQEACV